LNVTVHASSFIAELDEPAIVSPHFPTALIVPLMPHPLQFIEVPALSHDFRDFYKCSNTKVTASSQQFQNDRTWFQTKSAISFAAEGADFGRAVNFLHSVHRFNVLDRER
jgi:hypothetical protein